MALPKGVLAPVEEAGEEVLASILTAGTRAHVGVDGTEATAPIWVVATNRRVWLLAGDAAWQWAAAEGDPSTVRVVRGWTRDSLVAGPWETPLRTGTRAAAERLVARVRETEGGGEAFPPPAPPKAPGRAPVARGAGDVPAWLIDAVAGEPSERWLQALETSSTHPFNTRAGGVVRAPVWIAQTDRRTVLAARAEGQPVWSKPVSGALVHQHRSGRRDRLVAGERELWGALVGGRAVEVAVAIAAATPAPRRWAVAARCALDGGEVRQALRLLAEARDLGHDTGWSVLGRILLAVGMPELSVAATQRLLRLHPGLDVDTELGRWATSVSGSVKRDRVDISYVRGVLRETVASLEVPAAPPGLPWPPERAAGVWAAALALEERWDEATRMWAQRRTDPRQRQAVAALREAQGHPDAAATWDEAAAALRQAGDPHAPEALDRALRLEPTASRLWRRAAWAFDDGDEDTARGHWSAAVAIDADATQAVELSPSAERLVAAVAEEDAEWAAAAAAWGRAISADPEDLPSYRARAAVLADHTDDPAAAAACLDALVQRLPHEEAPEPRWEVLRDEAVLWLRAGNAEEAAGALRDAVEGDYLHPETLHAAIELAPQAGIDPAWWLHVHGVLAGTTGGTPRSPSDTLSVDELDALHPGGVGFMERMRQAFDGAEAPDRRTLVRGLEPVPAHGEVHDLVVRLCDALQLEMPGLFLFRGEGAFGCSAWATSPPVLLVGATHVGDGERTLPPEGLAFLLAVELVHLKCEHPVLSFDADLVGTSRSVYQTFGKYAGTAESLVDVVTLIPGVDTIAKLQTILLLSRRVFATRSTIDKLSGAATPVMDWLGIDLESDAGSVGRQGLAGAALQFRMQADRAALLLTGDLRAAVEAILKASSQSLDHAETVQSQGLAAALNGDEPPVEALRLAALLAFASTLQA